MARLRSMIFGLPMCIAISACANTYGQPKNAPEPAYMAPDIQGLELDFDIDKQDLRTIPGTSSELLSGIGFITNNDSTVREVPTILLVMLDKRQKIIFSQDIVPYEKVIAPGETIEVTYLAKGFPTDAETLEFSWKP
ncbi:hypothetical protein [Altererythrobacter rubellus]|uniref:Lipoprotein n=1 Tax=Altererythrobacter rubellus TaxID=2173831 RepID=A0A9Y2B7G5_9SPHN|nr:hypothetical protein [Altererythrobacter rubellus]WIW95460.1 hypothetical protein QQX03_11075 [Altererythrobacter rubellus]